MSKQMNDNENKPNAPTIKLPVQYADGYIFDADGQKIAFCDVGIKTLDAINAHGEQIAAALNEADALRAEVGRLTDVLTFYSHGCDRCGTDCEQDEGCGNRAYAVIKPNAAAGEEGTAM